MRRTLLVALFLHAIEDAALISVGRYLAVPTGLRYLLGMGISALILLWVLRRSRGRGVKGGEWKGA